MEKNNPDHSFTEIEFKSGMTYYAHHKPSGEGWVILGVNVKSDKVCAAGWPPSIGKLSDCKNFIERSFIKTNEREYRIKMFGTDWL